MTLAWFQLDYRQGRELQQSTAATALVSMNPFCAKLVGEAVL